MLALSVTAETSWYFRRIVYIFKDLLNLNVLYYFQDDDHYKGREKIINILLGLNLYQINMKKLIIIPWEEISIFKHLFN